MIGNLEVYRAIATEALADATAAEDAHRRPIGNGSPGFVISPDPERTSFKKSVIAIAFVGVYVDALLYIVGSQRLGPEVYRSIDRSTREARLKRLGVFDAALLDECRRFGEVRNDLVHEKATESFKHQKVWVAQREAKRAIAFMEQLENALPLPRRAEGPRIAG